MNYSQMQAFRQISDAMQTAPTDWQWVGKWMSQRMFGITEKRAKDYQARFGGEDKRICA